MGKMGIVLMLVVMIAAGCNFNFSVGKPNEPTLDEVKKLVSITMASFTESLEKDDFEILRKTASSELRKQASAEQFRKAFATYVEKRDKAVPFFRETQTVQPQIETPTMKEVDGIYLLETNGKFLTKEAEINFKISYLREDGKWKLLKIDIKT